MNDNTLENILIETSESYCDIWEDIESFWKHNKYVQHLQGKITLDPFSQVLDALHMIFESFPKEISLKLNQGEAIRLKHACYVIREGINGYNILIPLHELDKSSKNYGCRKEIEIKDGDKFFNLSRTIDIYLKKPSGVLAVGMYTGIKEPSAMPSEYGSNILEKTSKNHKTMRPGAVTKPKLGQQVELIVCQGKLTILPMAKLVSISKESAALDLVRAKAEKVHQLKLYSTHFSNIQLGGQRTDKVVIFSPEFDRDLFDLIVNEHEKRIKHNPIFQLDLMQQTAEAIEDLHNRLEFAHQDIKPANFLVQENKSGTKIVLCDFDDVTEEKETSRKSGTHTYFSQEKFEAIYSKIDKKTYNPFTADIFALGAVFYAIRYGHPPFHRDFNVAIDVYNKQQQYNEKIWLTLNKSDNKIDQLISEMLHKEPEKRPRINDVCDRLRTISTSLIKKLQASSKLPLNDNEEKNIGQNYSDLRDQSSPSSNYIQPTITKQRHAQEQESPQDNGPHQTDSFSYFHNSFFKPRGNSNAENRQPNTEQLQANTDKLEPTGYNLQNL